MKQIQSFHEHTRDNPFSRQYMWNAVAALSLYDARDLAIYFASLPPKPANDGDTRLLQGESRSSSREFPRPTSFPAMLVTAQMAKA